MNAKKLIDAQINLPHELAAFIKEYTKTYKFPNDQATLIFMLKDLNPRLHFKGQLLAQLAASKIKKQPLGNKRRIKYESEVTDADIKSIQ
mgnify:FL=1|tara:strand:+ start:3259 stop:3528 length:270 start_codon:yes stop_codon:yes gene_type:complete